MERWLPIAGHPGYEVSDHGRVRSVDRLVPGRWGPTLYRGRILKTNVTPKGYHKVGLSTEGLVRERYVHRLIAEAFLLIPDGSYLVRHLDDDPGHNHLANLAWGTMVENWQDHVRNTQ